MDSLNKILEKKYLLMAYKLLHDTLFILLVFFALALIAEGVLPGIIASHFGIPKIIILVMGNVFLITFLGHFLEIKSPSSVANKKMILAVSFLGILLIFNSLLKIGLVLNLLITLLAVGVVYLVYLVIFSE